MTLFQGAYELRHHENLKFIWFEDMKSNNRAVIADLCKFTGYPLSKPQLLATHCTSVSFVAIIFIFFRKKWSGECRFKRNILCTASSEIATNAIQHNIRRNYVCSKIATNGFFH